MNSLNVTALAVLLTACGGVAAQQPPGSLSTKAPRAFTVSAPKPALVEPAADFQLATQATRTTPALFRWSLPSGAPAPQRFILCIAEDGVTCSSQQAAIYEVGTVTQYLAQVPPRFHNKTLQWAVAACGPGYSSGLALAGSPNSDCSWSSARRLYAGYQPPAITLLSPAPNAVVSAKQRFTWQLPQGQAVDGFQLCIARKASDCEQESPGRQLVSVPAGKTFADVDFEFTYDKRPREWTVLSCKQGTCRMAANQQARSLLIPALELPKPADVTITLTEIRVRNRCDTVSPGDWALRIGAWESATHTITQDVKADWPASGSENVDDREWVRVNRKLVLEDVDPNSSIGASVSAVDCDADGIWTPFRLVQGTEGVAIIISDWQAHCGGEEVWEASGHNDEVGTAVLRLTPDQWRSANRTRFSAVAEGTEQCGRAPFTAFFEVTSSQ